MPKALVFAKPNGDRFLVEGFLFEDDVPPEKVIEAKLISIALTAGAELTVEPDLLDFDPANFPNVDFLISGRQFAHGAVHAALFAGPSFYTASAKP